MRGAEGDLDPNAMTTWADYRAFLWHNLAGHFVGYCLVWPWSPRLGRAIHDATLPRHLRD